MAMQGTQPGASDRESAELTRRRWLDDEARVRAVPRPAVSVSRGVATFQGRPSAGVLNPMGTVHGGWYATLIDSAIGCAVHTTLPAGRVHTALLIMLNIVRAVGLKVPLSRPVDRTLHVGRQVATAQGELVGPDGILYAHATTTCLLFDAK